MLNLNKLKTFYTKSPTFIKKLYSFIPYKYRNGKHYRQWMNILIKNENVGNNPLKTVQLGFDNFNFYKTKYDNILPTNWNSIPFLEKWETQENIDEFKNSNISKFYVTTGGVSGTPATFYQSKNIWFKELAFVNTFFGKYGYSPKDLKLSLRGGDFNNLPAHVYWNNNPISNEIHFSPFHLNKSTIELYVNQINKLKPRFFHSYPSGLLRLAQLMKENNLKLNYSPKCIFLISEAFSKQEFMFLKSFFNCKVTTFYGHSERLIFAEFEEESYSYIPNSKYGYFELINDKGEVITENNIIGEIVGTSYDNTAMPLIRYKTGDFTSYTDFTRKAFGEIQGKWGQDFLVGINNEQVTITALNLHSTELSDLIQIQFHQKAPGEVKILARFKNKKSSSEIESIEKMLKNRVGNIINFTIDLDCVLTLNQRGKCPLIIRNEN